MAIECLSTYGCGKFDNPLDGAVYTPYVRVVVGGEDLLLSGNASSPSNPHHAMITSFQYGTQTGTGGSGCVIEVVDEGGQTYEKIWRALSKDITKTKSDAMGCEVSFGWRIKKCDGGEEFLTNLQAAEFPDGGGGAIHLIPRKMSANFDGSIIKFTLECTDTFAARSTEARLESNIGAESDKVNLRPALERLFQEYDPKFETVKFISSSGETGGADDPAFLFLPRHGDPKLGYMSVHNMDQEADISCARKWMNNTLTINKKGVLIMYDPRDASVAFYEDPRDGNDCCGKGHLATFIVNGGNNSTVLSFSPTTDWNFGGNAGTGGVASGGSSADMGGESGDIEGGDGRGVKQKERPGLVNTGSQSQHLRDGNQWYWMTPEEQAKEAAFCFTQHNDATKSYEGMISPVQAELKIMGNPRWVNPLFLTAHWISIIVIDPYYIEKDTSTGDSCNWLSKSNCNPILSNKRWFIQGIDHQLTSGSYVTTLKVRLDAPGINVPSGDVLGGSGCGTESVSVETDPFF